MTFKNELRFLRSTGAPGYVLSSRRLLSSHYKIFFPVDCFFCFRAFKKSISFFKCPLAKYFKGFALPLMIRSFTSCPDNLNAKLTGAHETHIVLFTYKAAPLKNVLFPLRGELHFPYLPL